MLIRIKSDPKSKRPYRVFVVPSDHKSSDFRPRFFIQKDSKIALAGREDAAVVGVGSLIRTVDVTGSKVKFKEGADSVKINGCSRIKPEVKSSPIQ